MTYTAQSPTHALRPAQTVIDEAQPLKANLSKELVDEMQALFGKHPGYRTTHAKGLLVEGTFKPTAEAKTLSTASHFSNASTPVIARFSVGGGLPHIPDVNNNATPKGVAIRFLTDNNTHTDLISHSFNGFAARTGEDFLAFLRVLRPLTVAEAIYNKVKDQPGDHSKEKADFEQTQAAFLKFLATHPQAAAFVQSEKPNPHNYGTIKYYQVNTHVLTNQTGKHTNVRYRLIPADGEHLYTDPKDIQSLPPNYLEDDLRQRFPEKPLTLHLQAHIAAPDDVLDDATIPYKSTTFVSVGTVTFAKVADDNTATQKQIAFSPVPELGGVKGIRSSNDPLIQQRRGVYYISAEQRRAEKQIE